MRKSIFKERHNRQAESNKADKAYTGYIFLTNFIQRGIDIQKSKIKR